MPDIIDLYKQAQGRVNVKLVDLRVALISSINDWQQVRARGEEVEINALLDVVMKALAVVKKLAEDKDGHN